VGTRGTATFTTSFAATGGHTITAVFSGAPMFLGSSQSLTEQVNAAPTRKTTTLALFASANPVVVGQAVTFTATVRDPSGTATPTGTVTFFVGNTVVARVTLDANGQARIRGFFSVAGLFTIRAGYSGDARSQSLLEQVNLECVERNSMFPTGGADCDFREEARKRIGAKESKKKDG